MNLYECPEKPQNAINFIKESMGPPPAGGNSDELQAKVKELTGLLTEKDKEIEDLKKQLAELSKEANE